MEKYSYIIVGIIILIFNVYRKAMKKKKDAETALQMQQQQQRQQQSQEPKQTEPKENFATDLLQDFDKYFKDTEDDFIPKSETSKKTYNIPDIEDIMRKNEQSEDFEENIEEYNVDAKTIVKPKNITKNNVKINLKQAIIYNAILEKKY